MPANDQPPKAVLELSQKLQENATKLKMLDAQKRALETDIRRAVITAHHLNEVKDDTVTYRSVGKAYMCVERAEILENLEAAVKAADAEGKGVQREHGSACQGTGGTDQRAPGGKIGRRWSSREGRGVAGDTSQQGCREGQAIPSCRSGFLVCNMI